VPHVHQLRLMPTDFERALNAWLGDSAADDPAAPRWTPMAAGADAPIEWVQKTRSKHRRGTSRPSSGSVVPDAEADDDDEMGEVTAAPAPADDAEGAEGACGPAPPAELPGVADTARNVAAALQEVSRGARLLPLGATLDPLVVTTSEASIRAPMARALPHSTFDALVRQEPAKLTREWEEVYCLHAPDSTIGARPCAAGNECVAALWFDGGFTLRECVTRAERTEYDRTRHWEHPPYFCVLCERFRTQQFFFAAMSCDVGPYTATVRAQRIQNITDEPGEYAAEDCIGPITDRHTGLWAPIVMFSTVNVVPDPARRRFVQRLAVVAPSHAQLVVSETHFF
jgi:hypothetical protein